LSLAVGCSKYPMVKRLPKVHLQTRAYKVHSRGHLQNPCWSEAIYGMARHPKRLMH